MYMNMNNISSSFSYMYVVLFYKIRRVYIFYKRGNLSEINISQHCIGLHACFRVILVKFHICCQKQLILLKLFRDGGTYGSQNVMGCPVEFCHAFYYES